MVMIDRLFTRCMIRPEDIAPSSDAMRVVGVLNPGAAPYGKGVMLIARVVEEPVEQRSGFIASPRVDPEHGIVTDWLDEKEYNTDDPRLVTHKKTGSLRLRFLSHLKVVYSKDGRGTDGFTGPVITPQGPYEVYGIEDPRITLIGSTYYITYVAVSPWGISTALMSTTDFQSFRRHGLIFCPDNKDVVLFPEKVMGEYIALHRPSGAARFDPPDVWLARSPDMVHWGTHMRLIGADAGTLQDRIGGGTPPIRTREGWLTIYHRSEKSELDDAVGIYSGYAMLLDLDNPTKVLGLSPEPIMTPTETFETTGYVDNVIFPTGIVDRNDKVLVYYGAADKCIGVTAFSRESLIDSVTAAAV
jgi:beta-1,2-mannobiose phosphorylase / 1,2-beta-oligomannan phosphorylase